MVVVCCLHICWTSGKMSFIAACGVHIASFAKLQEEPKEETSTKRAGKSAIETAANEAVPGGNLMTDSDIMGCMNAEKMWRKVRKRAAAGKPPLAQLHTV